MKKERVGGYAKQAGIEVSDVNKVGLVGLPPAGEPKALQIPSAVNRLARAAKFVCESASELQKRLGRVVSPVAPDVKPAGVSTEGLHEGCAFATDLHSIAVTVEASNRILQDILQRLEL